MMKTLFENAVVLTMDDEMRLISNGYVLTEGKNIAEVGEGTYGGEADERRMCGGDPGPQPAPDPR